MGWVVLGYGLVVVGVSLRLVPSRIVGGSASIGASLGVILVGVALTVAASAAARQSWRRRVYALDQLCLMGVLWSLGAASVSIAQRAVWVPIVFAAVVALTVYATRDLRRLDSCDGPSDGDSPSEWSDGDSPRQSK